MTTKRTEGAKRNTGGMEDTSVRTMNFAAAIIPHEPSLVLLSI